MKIRHLILSALATAALASACQEEEILGLPELTVSSTELTFGVDAGSQNVTIKATRDWMVENLPEWMALDPQKGLASTKEQTVTVTVMPNSGVNRTADVKFSIGLMSRIVKVVQAGEAGSEEDAILYFNDFDKEAAPSASPFPYCDASAIWKNQTGKGAESVEYLTSKLSVRGNSPSNSHNSENYTGSGVNNLFFGENGFLAIKKIALSGATNMILTFGSERYLYGAEDNTFKHDEFLVSASIDGSHFASLEYAFPAGDLSGTWDLAKAEFAVPEGTEFLYLHFTTTLASAYRLDDVKLLRGGSGTAPDYANGKVIDISGGDTPGGDTPGGDTPGVASGDGSLANPYNPVAANNAVKNLTWTSNTEYQKTDKVYVKGKISRIANNGTFTGGGTYGNASFYISEDGSQSNEFYVFRTLYFGGEKYTSGTDIKVGDEVIIYGALMNYRGNTPETVAGENWLYSLNGATDGSGTPGGDTPGGDTPVVDGESLAAIIAKKVAGERIDIQTVEVFVGAVTTKGFVVTDGTDHIYVYANSTPTAKVGDKVSVKGKIEDYYGLPEITGPTVTVISSGATVPYPTAKDITASIDSYSATVAEYITVQAEAYQSGNYINYKVEGATRGVELSSAPSALTTSVKAGDKVTLTGYFNTIHSQRNNVQLILVKVEGGSGETPGDTPGGDTPGGDQTDYSSNVVMAAGTSSQLGKVKVNGGSTEFDCLKMGTSSKLGEGTVTLPAGASKVSFYAIGWTSTPSTLVAEIGEAKREIAVAANATVSGNTPWTVTVADSDHYTIDLGAALPAETQVKVSTKCDADATGKYTQGRVILFAIKAE